MNFLFFEVKTFWKFDPLLKILPISQTTQVTRSEWEVTLLLKDPYYTLYCCFCLFACLFWFRSSLQLAEYQILQFILNISIQIQEVSEYQSQIWFWFWKIRSSHITVCLIVVLIQIRTTVYTEYFNYHLGPGRGGFNIKRSLQMSNIKFELNHFSSLS